MSRDTSGDQSGEYSKRFEFLPCKLDEFETTNGYFYKYSLMQGKRTAPNGIVIDMPDSTPYHTELLHMARDQGLLSQADLDSVKPALQV